VDDQGALQAGPSIGERRQVMVSTPEMTEHEGDISLIGRAVPLRDDEGMLETRPDSGQLARVTEQAAAGVAVPQFWEGQVFDVMSMSLAEQLTVHILPRQGDAGLRARIGDRR
jgi:hypothetical protein